jgi:hypothetical protein
MKSHATNLRVAHPSTNGDAEESKFQVETRHTFWGSLLNFGFNFQDQDDVM